MFDAIAMVEGFKDEAEAELAVLLEQPPQVEYIDVDDDGHVSCIVYAHEVCDSVLAMHWARLCNSAPTRPRAVFGASVAMAYTWANEDVPF